MLLKSEMYILLKHLFSFPVFLLDDLQEELFFRSKNFQAFSWYLTFFKEIP